MAEPRPPLHGVDGPRPMPAGLRARIEAELLAGAGAAGGAGEAGTAAGAAMSDEAKGRLARRLADPTAAVLTGVDGPRDMPGALRRRVEDALAGGEAHVRVVRRPRLVPELWLAAAACLALLVVSVTVLASRPTTKSPYAVPTAGMSDEASGPAASVGSGALSQAGVGNPGFVSGGSAASTNASTAAPTKRPRTTSAAGGLASAPIPDNSPPPYALGDYEASFSNLEADTASGSASPPPPPTTTTTTVPPPPLRVRVVSGDSVEQAGFNAYVDLLNQSGGAGRRRFEIVTSTADVTVNLSGTPFAAAPSGVGLDDFWAPESSLHDGVFAFGGVPERQAHLIADAVYPDAAPNTSAAVYREPSGPLGTSVPDAIDAVLRARSVTPIDVTVQPGRPIVPVPADAVFLSLTPDHATSVTAAYANGPAPSRGFNGIGNLADAAAPAGVRVLSPYAFPDSNEARDLGKRANQPLSARLVHGWVAAKTLAVAVWREDPRTPDALRNALERMQHYANGFAPAYTFRSGTHSVQPEGVVLVNGKQDGDFRTDPF